MERKIIKAIFRPRTTLLYNGAPIYPWVWATHYKWPKPAVRVDFRSLQSILLTGIAIIMISFWKKITMLWNVVSFFGKKNCQSG